MEPTSDEEEPTLGWPAGGTRLSGSVQDGEAEPSLGWTGITNQASRNGLGDGEDCEKDDADREDGDPAEDGHDMEAGGVVNPKYFARLKARRGSQQSQRRFIVSPEGVAHELVPVT